MPSERGGKQTTVALISGHHLLQLGLQQLMTTEKSIRLVQQSATNLNVDELLAHEKPQVIVIDQDVRNDLPALFQKVKASAPATKIILLCSMEQAERSRQTLHLAIDGIVLKVQPAQVLIAAIKHLMGIAGTTTPVAPIAIPGPPSRSNESELTERQREIVKLVAEGLSNKDIAARMHLADTTVRHHLTKIFDKLGVPNRQKLLVRAHQQDPG